METKERRNNRPDLSITEWTPQNLNLLSGKSGVYAIYLDHYCLYVGASQKLRNRLRRIKNKHPVENTLLYLILMGHKKILPGSILKIDIYFSPIKNLRNLESIFVYNLRPKLNENNRFYRKMWLETKEAT